MDRKLDRERIAIYSLMVGAFNYKTKAFNETSRPRQRNVDGMISLQLNSRLCFDFCIFFFYFTKKTTTTTTTTTTTATKKAPKEKWAPDLQLASVHSGSQADFNVFIIIY